MVWADFQSRAPRKRKTAQLSHIISTVRSEVSKPLVVVESPTKIRTLKKYLGSAYNVTATVGHIRDLPPKEMGVDVEKGFKPKYRTIAGKQKVIAALKRAAGTTDEVFLAPDPDREGEAIAYHTAEVLKKKGRKFHRVLFHELTQNAIQAAISSPEELDIKKYEAQQTRRILDRLVGYHISPLLWRKVKGGLSAGRVQSVTLRIVCERERAIQAFDSVEYWSITAQLAGESPPPFAAKLAKQNGKKIQIPDEKAAKAITDELETLPFVVDKVEKKVTKRNPLPPFITSKLQQEAIRKLGFSARKTMTVAQQLYEGVDLGPGEPEGLITYMRTDSTRIAVEAAQEALQLIEEQYGKEYSLEKPRFFKNRKKVQDAHEAIRPTSVQNTPEKLKSFLSKDQLSLYSLIWKRFVASQMAQALINQDSVSIAAGTYQLTSTGSSVKFPGFMTLYMSVDAEMERKSDDGKEIFPELTKGMTLQLNGLEPKQHFTMPPPRFTEASLVKELEENGIGRPSTYAAILSTIRDKGYVELTKGQFIPSELGFIVSDLLIDNFPNLFDIDFTAKMEDDLDRIEAAEVGSLELLTRFYEPFKAELESATDGMLSVRGVGVRTDLSCPLCDCPLHIKIGKNGHYLACSGYPDCKYTRNYLRDEKGKICPVEPVPDKVSDKVCDKCKRPMIIKQGKYGPFLACSGYPECKNTQSMNPEHTAQNTGVDCPEEGCAGKLVERKSKRGKIFYSCSKYPTCTFAIWDKPVPKECPQCGASFLVEKTTKREGTFLRCLDKECGYRE